MKNMEKKLKEHLFLQREYQISHRPYDRELAFYQIIKEGNLKELENITFVRQGSELGVLSKNPTRNLKYHVIVCIAMITRFCIEGGMEPEEAYTLSDLYIQSLDVLTEEKAILDLQKSMAYEFTSKMNALHKFKKFSKPVILAMDYIFSNLNQKLTVQLIADQVKRNPDYISRQFKKETGQTLSVYIREKRIEAAKNMLIYSDSPVSDIAQYLNFNSHSHFIEVFKMFEKVTPKEYRELHFRRNFS